MSNNEVKELKEKIDKISNQFFELKMDVKYIKSFIGGDEFQKGIVNTMEDFKKFIVTANCSSKEERIKNLEEDNKNLNRFKYKLVGIAIAFSSIIGILMYFIDKILKI